MFLGTGIVGIYGLEDLKILDLNWKKMKKYYF